MASGQKTYTADHFKKSKDCSVAENTRNISKLKISNYTTTMKTVVNEDSETENVSNEDSDISSDDEERDYDRLFNEEDKLIARLYREVVDDIMTENKLLESHVDSAISEIKNEIHKGHKRGFKKFEGIDFCKSSNRCAYLRRYAMCHTGLVKKAIWRFLMKDSQCRYTIFSSDQFKVVSLGGGPGNDLIGLCCALQEKRKSVKELDLAVVDISQGWNSVFPSILKKANTADFGSLSKFLKHVTIHTSFMQRNLSLDQLCEDELLSSVIGEADVVLMVKLVSFMSDQDASKLLQNVVDSMQDGALLLFIDQPYDKELFRRISSLKCIYHDSLTYVISFNPRRFLSKSIDSSQAHICIFQKDVDLTSSDEDSSVNDES